MNLLIVNIVLALTWAALTGTISLENLLVGFILGYITLYLAKGALGDTSYFKKGTLLVKFIFYFTWELFLANIRVARDVLRPGPLRMVPRVIAVPLEKAGDFEVMLLANVLSLTPGTLSLDVSGDKRILFVHAIHAPDAAEARRQIQEGFGVLVANLFREPSETNPHPLNDSNKGEK